MLILVYFKDPKTKDINMKNSDTTPFIANKYQCADCKDIIWSKYEGEFVRCKCDNIFIDETRYYCRWGFKKSKPVLVEKGNAILRELESLQNRLIALKSEIESIDLKMSNLSNHYSSEKVTKKRLMKAAEISFIPYIAEHPLTDSIGALQRLIKLEKK